MTNSLLQIDNVSFSYSGSNWKLDAVSLHVRKGEFVGIVGANGSGKSTLLKITAGLLAPENGTVLIDKTPVGKIPRRILAQKLGYLPQQVSSVFDFNVREVVLMGRFCRSKGLAAATAEDRKIANDCMEVTEVSAFQDRSINELSGGERQRVLLASVLAQQPDIMLLDEPVAGLDLHHQVSFFKLLARLSAEGMSVLTITHDFNLASQFCGKILLMDRGKRIVCDSTEKVFERIQKMKSYREDITIFEHPCNRKPAILPWHRCDEGGK